MSCVLTLPFIIPVAIVFYTALAAEFLWRFAKDKPLRAVVPGPDQEAQEAKDSTSSNRFNSRMKLQIYGLILSTLFLFIRSIYRTIEVAFSSVYNSDALLAHYIEQLNDGWTGRIISTEIYFNILDGSMIVLAMYTMNIFHPTWLLRPSSEP